jgi:hypothetical protein
MDILCAFNQLLKDPSPDDSNSKQVAMESFTAMMMMKTMPNLLNEPTPVKESEKCIHLLQRRFE